MKHSLVYSRFGRAFLSALALGLAAAGSAISSEVVTSANSCGIVGFQQKVILAINKARATGARCGVNGTFTTAAALTWSDALFLAAAGHSEDMAQNTFLKHTGTNNSTMGTRITNARYKWAYASENIASGYPTIDSVIDGWMSSVGHCKNIMSERPIHVAVACVKNAQNNTFYWTQVFAKP